MQPVLQTPFGVSENRSPWLTTIFTFYFYLKKTAGRVSVRRFVWKSYLLFWLMAPAVVILPMMMMVMMPAAPVIHRAHPPAAEAAVGMHPRAIVPEKRACEQPADKRHYQDKNDKTKHRYSPFAGSPALDAAAIKKRGFSCGVCRIKVSPVMLSRVIFGSPSWRRARHFRWLATPFLHLR